MKSECLGVGPRTLHFSTGTTYLEILTHDFRDTTLLFSLSLLVLWLLIFSILFYRLLFSLITLEIFFPHNFNSHCNYWSNYYSSEIKYFQYSLLGPLHD